MVGWMDKQNAMAFLAAMQTHQSVRQEFQQGLLLEHAWTCASIWP